MKKYKNIQNNIFPQRWRKKLQNHCECTQSHAAVCTTNVVSVAETSNVIGSEHNPTFILQEKNRQMSIVP